MPFCCMRYIDDSTYLPGNESTDMLKRSQTTQNNVSFVYMLSPKCRSDLMIFVIIAANALEINDKGEKPYDSYVSGYTFSKVGCNRERL